MLFQFRVVRNGISNRKRVCEERIILFEADSVASALKMARKRGKKDEFSYDAEDAGATVFFEFVGVLDLVDVNILENDEVWYRLVEKLEPIERKEKILPAEHDFSASKAIKRTKGRVLVP